MRRAEDRTLSTFIPVLVTGIQQRRVCGAEEPFSPRTWSGWIPVTSTEMRRSNRRRVARISTRPRAGMRKSACGFARVPCIDLFESLRRPDLRSSWSKAQKPPDRGRAGGFQFRKNSETIISSSWRARPLPGSAAWPCWHPSSRRSSPTCRAPDPCSARRSARSA